jgi:hypothetical protein
MVKEKRQLIPFPKNSSEEAAGQRAQEHTQHSPSPTALSSPPHSPPLTPILLPYKGSQLQQPQGCASGLPVLFSGSSFKRMAELIELCEFDSSGLAAFHCAPELIYLRLKLPLYNPSRSSCLLPSHPVPAAVSQTTYMSDRQTQLRTGMESVAGQWHCPTQMYYKLIKYGTPLRKLSNVYKDRG